MAQKNLSRARSLQRRRPSLQQRKRFLVVCEGEKTEPEYFAHVKDALRDSLLMVKVVGGLGDPLQLVEYAIEQKVKASRDARKQADDNLAFDEVWCVFDVDSFTRIPQAEAAAVGAGVRLAISNPCFEVWALLHFRFSSASLSSKEAAEALSEHMAGYEKSLECEKLRGKYPAAKKNAIKLDNEHDLNGSAPRSNPSSGVWGLVDEILLSASRAGMTGVETLV